MLTLDLTNAPQWCDLSRETLRTVLGSFEQRSRFQIRRPMQSSLFGMPAMLWL